jgi:hypothetical protein
MKKPFGLAGETVVFGAVVVLTVFGELDPAEPQAATSIASETPLAARHANLRCDAIGTKRWHLGGVEASGLVGG